MKSFENFIIDDDKKQVIFKVNLLLYDKRVVISACYSIQKSANVLLSGDFEKDLSVFLIAKDSNANLFDLAFEFSNLLVRCLYEVERLKNTDKQQDINDLSCDCKDNSCDVDEIVIP